MYMTIIKCRRQRHKIIQRFHPLLVVRKFVSIDLKEIGIFHLIQVDLSTEERNLQVWHGSHCSPDSFKVNSFVLQCGFDRRPKWCVLAFSVQFLNSVAQHCHKELEHFENWSLLKFNKARVKWFRITDAKLRGGSVSVNKHNSHGCMLVCASSGWSPRSFCSLDFFCRRWKELIVR